MARLLIADKVVKLDVATGKGGDTVHSERCAGTGLVGCERPYLLQKQQRPAEASERFKTALSLRPNEGRWWFGLGLSLENAGRGDEAKEAYAQAKQVGNLPADMAATVEQKLR